MNNPQAFRIKMYGHPFRKADIVSMGYHPNGSKQTAKILKAYKDNLFKKILRQICSFILRWANQVDGEYKLINITNK